MVLQPTPRELLHVLFRRKLAFLLAFLVVAGLGAAYLALTTPLYSSDTQLVVRFGKQVVPNMDRTNDPDNQLLPNDRREIIYSNVAILQSPDLIRHVISDVGLARIYPKLAAHPKPGLDPMDQALRQFRADMNVDVGQQNDVISLAFLNPSPAVAREVVQHLVDGYLDHEAAVYADPQVGFLKAEADGAAQRLATARSALEGFKAANGINDLNQQVFQLLQQRTDVESRLPLATARMEEAQQREATLKSMLQSVPANVTSTAAGEKYRGIDDVSAKLADLRAKRQQMSATYLPGSRVLAQLDASIASLESDAKQQEANARGRASTQPNLVYQNIQTDLIRASAEARAAKEPADVLRQQLDSINTQLAGLEKNRNQYDQLRRSAQISEDAYKALATRYEEARVESSRNSAKISSTTVIAQPSLPDRPARPRTKVVIAATLLAALILASGTAFLVEAADDRIHAPHEVAASLHLPVLATFRRNY